MPGLIPESVIEEVSSRTDILALVQEYVPLHRKGDRWWGLCPFHTEKTSSFSVTPSHNLWYCFGCQKGGGTFQFLMEIDGLSFPEAIRRLAEKAGVEIPQGEDSEKSDRRAALGELYLRVARTFQWLFINDAAAAKARNFLEERGISSQTAQAFQVGWAPADGEWLYHFLIKKKYSSDFLAFSGLFSRKSPRWSLFVDRLIFPIMPEKDRVTAFSGRTLSGRGPKYINSPETVLYHKEKQLFGFAQGRDAIRKEKAAVLCEGNLDIMAMHEAGIPHTAAPLGTAFTESQARLLKRYADTLILAFDGDEAGRRATMKAAITGEKAGLQLRALVLPPGKDPADLLKEEGINSLKKAVGESINIFDYLLDYVIDIKPDTIGEAQEEALEELTPFLTAVSSEIRREAFIKKMAQASGADPHTLLKDYRQKASREKTGFKRKKESPASISKTEDEVYLLTAVSVRTELFSLVCHSLDASDFQDSRGLVLYRALEELTKDGETPGTDDVLSFINDDELRQLIIRRAASGVFDQNLQQLVRDGVKKIKKRSLKRERREIEAELSRWEESSLERQQRLLTRKITLDKEIDGI